MTGADRPQLAPLTGWEYDRSHGLDSLTISGHHEAADITTNPLRPSEAESTSQLSQPEQDARGRRLALPRRTIPRPSLGTGTIADS